MPHPRTSSTAPRRHSCPTHLHVLGIAKRSARWRTSPAMHHSLGSGRWRRPEPGRSEWFRGFASARLHPGSIIIDVASGVGRFQVMAPLQAARAKTLGLPTASAKSWGLKRAIYYAAANRGSQGGKGPAYPKKYPTPFVALVLCDA